MNLTSLEQIVGPINRGQLSCGFKPSFEVALEEVPAYFNDDRKLYKPPEGEDLSHLNAKYSKKMSAIAQDYWDRMTPEQRNERKKHLSAAGKKGGSAMKNMRHLHGV